MNRHAPYSADYTWDIISGIPRSRNPFFHEERLEEPIGKKSPQLIVVAPHRDLFHEYVSREKILHVWAIMTELAPWHQYMIRTQFPQRLLELQTSLKWTPNLWIGGV